MSYPVAQATPPQRPILDQVQDDSAEKSFPSEYRGCQRCSCGETPGSTESREIPYFAIKPFVVRRRLRYSISALDSDRTKGLLDLC